MSRYIKTVSKNKTIAFQNREEFKQRLNTLFYVSGLMKISSIDLLGRQIGILRPIDSEKEEDMNFIYHCFGRMDLKNERFGDIMCAAHILETLYLEDYGIVMDNCKPILYKEKYYLGWFNYLFGTQFTLHNWDKWKAYLSLKDERGFDMNDFDKTFEMNYGYYPIISNCEVLAVEYGIDELNKELSLDKYKELYFIRGIKDIKGNIKDFKENSDMNLEEQVNILIQVINEYIAEKHDVLDELKDDIYLKDINISLMIMDSPILITKAIAEVYDVDFWELYKQLDDYEERRFYSRDLLNVPITPINTIDFFGVNPDDLLYYWKEDGDIELSDEMNDWFVELKKQYDTILDEGIHLRNPVDWLFHMLSFADEHYYKIMPYAECLDETLIHIDDSRYLAIWKIFKNMCQDEEMLKKGSSLLYDMKDNNIRLDLINTYKGPIKNNWWVSYGEDIMTSTRVKLLRYLALIANKELRQMVFGF